MRSFLRILWCVWTTTTTTVVVLTLLWCGNSLACAGSNIAPIVLYILFSLILYYSIGRPASLHLEINLTLEIGQVLLSLLHAWGLDKDLDKVAISKLGLLKPKAPVSYGLMSKGGIMSLMLPTWKMKKNENVDFFTGIYVCYVCFKNRAKSSGFA